MACTMFFDFKLPTELWDEAISHPNWLQNSLHSKQINMETPHTIWNNYRPDLSTILTFCTKGFSFQYRPDVVHAKKFLIRILFGHFVGMESDHELYRIYAPTLKQEKARSHCSKR